MEMAALSFVMRPCNVFLGSFEIENSSTATLEAFSFVALQIRCLYTCGVQQRMGGSYIGNHWCSFPKIYPG